MNNSRNSTLVFWTVNSIIGVFFYFLFVVSIGLSGPFSCRSLSAMETFFTFMRGFSVFSFVVLLESLLVAGVAQRRSKRSENPDQTEYIKWKRRTKFWATVFTISVIVGFLGVL